MTIDRRLFIGAALGMAVAPASAAAQQWGDPPTPYAPGPGLPIWPPAEHFPSGRAARRARPSRCRPSRRR